MRAPSLASPFASSSRARFSRQAAATALAALTMHALAPRAHAICRVVEPSVDSGGAGVAFDQTTAALFVAAPEVVVDWRCPAGDAAVDASADPDASSDPGDADTDTDAAIDDDAAAIDLDAALDLDAGAAPPDDAGPLPDPDAPPRCADGTPAEPVLGPVVSLVVQPRVLEQAGDAGLVMPVPARPDLAAGPPTMFQTLRAVATTGADGQIHETVTVVEDATLGLQCTDPHYVVDASDVILAAPLALYGCSASPSGYYRAGTTSRDAGVVYYGDSSVIEESIPVSEEYDAVALSASDASALSAWLDDHQFAHSEVDDAAFAAYVGPGRWFVAVHVHPRPAAGAGGSSTDLLPLVVSWQGSELPISNRLQFDPRGGSLVTDAFVLAPERRDAADGSAVTLSASLAPADPMLAGFGVTLGWLTHLRIGRDQSVDLPDSAIIPATGGVVNAPTIERTTTVHIPAACCPGGGAADRSQLRTFVHERTYASSDTPPPLPEAWLRTSLDASSSVCAAHDYGYGYGGCSSTSASGGRTLRGCAVVGPRWPTFAPLMLAIAWIIGRARKRR